MLEKYGLKFEDETTNKETAVVYKMSSSLTPLQKTNKPRNNLVRYFYCTNSR